MTPMRRRFFIKVACIAASGGFVSIANKSDNERSGVLSTTMSFLGHYRDPVVAEVTRRCDLIADDRPAALYLVVRPPTLRHQPHEASR